MRNSDLDRKTKHVKLKNQGFRSLYWGWKTWFFHDLARNHILMQSVLIQRSTENFPRVLQPSSSHLIYSWLLWRPLEISKTTLLNQWVIQDVEGGFEHFYATLLVEPTSTATKFTICQKTYFDLEEKFVFQYS